MAVHNHGAEEGPGLSCNETEIDGDLKGVCLRFKDAQDLGLISEIEPETPMLADYNMKAEQGFLGLEFKEEN
jgi:hypothetical protein